MNVEPTYQLIECDQDTAIQHLAMAQMMDEENAEQDGVRIPAEQDNVMQLSLVSGETYENKDQLFSYSINDYAYYLNSFNSNIPGAEIDSIATNTQQIMGKNITNTQLVENQIVNILRSNSETSMMDHPQLIKFLYDELHTLGFKDLEKVDVLKHTSVVRDPITKEALVPFETRPTKSDMMKNLAWETIHQEAQNHLDKENLKKKIN